MALLYMEGFEDGLLDERKEFGTLAAISTLYGRLGSSGIRAGDTHNSWFTLDHGVDASTIIVGFAVYINGVDSTNNTALLWFQDSSYDPQLRLVFENAGPYKLKLVRSGETTALVEAEVPVSEWLFVELKITFNDTTGAAEIKIDGTSIDSATSIDTQITTNANCRRIQFAGTTGSDINSIYLDDIYVADTTGTVNNDFLGDCRVIALLPDGNGNYSNMTGSDGNSTDNYLLVDENPPVTTDYVASSTQGDEDTYTMEDITDTGDTIHGVMATLYGTKDDTGTKYLRPLLRISSTDYPGTSVALQPSPAHTVIDEVWEQNPNTTSAWTATVINGMEVGQEVRDS